MPTYYGLTKLNYRLNDIDYKSYSVDRSFWDIIVFIRITRVAKIYKTTRGVMLS